MRFEDDNVKFNVLTLFGIKFYFFRGYKLPLCNFSKEYKQYYKENKNIKEKIKKLKKGLDKISVEYINKVISISKYPYKYVKNNFNRGFSKYDKKMYQQCQKYNFVQPFPDITEFDPYIFYSSYGMKDLPKEVLSSIKGKDIIDAGGFTGDTAVLFNNMFENSKIYVYEPLEQNLKTIEKIIQKGKFDNIIPVQKGLGDKYETCEVTFNYTETVQIVPLDGEYKGNNLGLIKSDTEGFEEKILDGSVELIKKFKPVLVFAMYHTPKHFFELKEKIQNINPEYKFMIRRSELNYPCIDLVLMAY